MNFEIFMLLTACFLFHKTLGFRSRLPPPNAFSHSSNLACLHANPLDEDISSIAEVDDNDDDDDFLAMQREIALSITSSSSIADTSSTPAPTTVLPSVRNYNNDIAVASAILGSFFFAFQHSQPVSGISLMHAMERDSVELQVRGIQIMTAFF